MDDIILRRELKSDYRAVEAVVRDAFWNHHTPGCNEHYLIHILRDDNSFVRELDYVAEIEGKIIGSIVYAKAKVIDDSGVDHDVLTFGPISVLPEYQRKGVGRKLIAYTIERAKELGYCAILIYGDPDIYSKLGFVNAEYFGIATDDNMYATALQAMELCPGSLENICGRFYEGPIYNIDTTAANEFDKDFERKTLIDELPTQKRFRDLLMMRRPRD